MHNFKEKDDDFKKIKEEYAQKSPEIWKKEWELEKKRIQELESKSKNDQ